MRKVCSRDERNFLKGLPDASGTSTVDDVDASGARGEGAGGARVLLVGMRGYSMRDGIAAVNMCEEHAMR